MKKLLASRTLFAVTVLVMVVLVAACRGANPTSTPVPPTVEFPTPLPVAPTAPPLTEAPTAVLPTDVPPAGATETPVIALATATTAAPEPTSTTASSTTTKPANPTRSTTGKTTGGAPPPQTGPLEGLYVAGIRFDPTYPRNQDPLTFYVTMVNRNSREQNYPICVEVFHPDAKKSFGISNCDSVTIPVGTHEVLAGSWTASGVKECIPVRARAVLHELDTDNVRLPLVTLQGGELWADFNVCP